MATPSPNGMTRIGWSQFKIEIAPPRSDLLELMSRRKPTVFDVERQVAKLKSVSKAGRAWIVDERCKRLSIGKHKDKIYFETLPPIDVDNFVYRSFVGK